MAHANKKEVEIFYKTHNLSIKEVAKHFNISYRTLAHWAKAGAWEAGSALENVAPVTLLQAKSDKLIDLSTKTMQRQIKQNLGELAFDVDSLVLNNLLESSTDEILLKTISLNYIQKNIALSAVIAKDALLRLIASDVSAKDQPIVVACAEKVAKIFSDMQGNFYGKEARINATQNVQNMSVNELFALLKEQKQEDQQ